MRRFMEHCRPRVNPPFTIYKCGMLRVSVVHYSGNMALPFPSFFVLSCFQTCYLRVELALAANIVLSGRVVP